MKRVALALLVLTAAPAAADRVTALKYFRSGEKAYRAQSFAAAAQAFYQAFQELPLPEIAFSAAQAYRRQYRIDHERANVERAVEMYRFYLDKVTSGGRVGDAADSLGEMEAELARLGGPKSKAPAVAHTQLGVTVNLAGTSATTSLTEIDDAKSSAPAIAVTATIDGKPIAPDTLVDVEPGEHQFHVEAKGFAPADKKGIALAGKADFIEFELKPLPAQVTIATESGARVNVDGRGVGIAPFQQLTLEAGRHVVTFSRRGREPVSREIVIERGQTFTLHQPLVPTRQRRSVKWVLLGAGALAIVTGASGIAAVVADGNASDKLAELEQGSQDASVLASYRQSRDRRDQLVTATWIAGSATLAVAAAAAILYFADSPSTEGVRVTPFVSESSGGASLITRF